MFRFIIRKKLCNKLLDIWKANPNNECVEHVLFAIALDLLGKDLLGIAVECKREKEFKRI